jgi:signal transduction histidine kinase
MKLDSAKLLKERTFAERAYSLPTFLTLAIPGGFLAIVGDPARGPERFFTWLGVVTVATIFAGVFFGLFGTLVFKHLNGWWRVILGFAGFAITGSIRGGLLGTFGLLTGAIDEVNWQFRLGGGAIVAVVLFPLAATLVNDFATYRARLSELTANQEKLAELASSAKAELESRKSLMFSDVNTRLSSTIAEISAQADKGRSADEYKLLASSLLQAVETVVRPLSKEVLVESREPVQAAIELAPRGVNLKSWLLAATVTQPFRPWPVTLIWAAIGASTISALQPGFPGVLAYPLFVGSTWALLAFGERYLTGRIRTYSLPKRAAVIFSWYLVAAAIPAVLSWIPLANIERPGFEALAITLLVLDPIATVSLCLVVGMLAGLRVERDRVLAETKAVNKRLSWELAAMRAELRATRKQISRSIHSDVQAVFIASAMKLQVAIGSGKVTQELLQELIQNLNQIGNINPVGKATPSLSKALEELKSFWGDGVAIKCEFNGETEEALVSNDLLRATLIEVCSEAVINAVKHGQASKVSIQLSLGPAVLKLAVLNEGKPVPDQFRQGAGLRLAKEVSVESGLRNTPEGTLFSAVLPIPKS